VNEGIQLVSQSLRIHDLRYQMARPQRRYNKEEFARRGDEVYKRLVRPQLKAADDGKFVAVDIETGAYEMDADELTACDRLAGRLPRAQIWLVRVGFPDLCRFGGLELRGKP
jgi:hypothetical protein